MLGEAALYGAIVGAAFPVGSVLSRFNPFGHRGFAAVMAFGAGLLLAASLVELAPDAVHHLGVVPAAVLMVLAGATYSLLNRWLSSRGAEHRKRCGGCARPPTEEEQPGSGASIALGTAMDALPEALVLGVGVTAMGAPLSLVIALFLGNAAQAMSATSGLRHSGRGPRFVWGLWIGLGALVTALSVIAAWCAGELPSSASPALMALAAGVLIAMVAEAMLPEASSEAENSPAPPALGLLAVLGAALFFGLHA